jgi:hypothetical protein
MRDERLFVCWLGLVTVCAGRRGRVTWSRSSATPRMSSSRASRTCGSTTRRRSPPPTACPRCKPCVCTVAAGGTWSVTVKRRFSFSLFSSTFRDPFSSNKLNPLLPSPSNYQVLNFERIDRILPYLRGQQTTTQQTHCEAGYTVADCYCWRCLRMLAATAWRHGSPSPLQTHPRAHTSPPTPCLRDASPRKTADSGARWHSGR